MNCTLCIFDEAISFIKFVCNVLHRILIHYILFFSIIVMQELIQTRKILEDQRKQMILEVIADKYCKHILSSTLNEPKSAMQISHDENIPISTVYRRLQTLYDAKLLTISGSINEDGKKYFLYKSKVKSISIKCDLQEAIVEIEPNISSTC